MLYDKDGNVPEVPSELSEPFSVSSVLGEDVKSGGDGLAAGRRRRRRGRGRSATADAAASGQIVQEARAHQIAGVRNKPVRDLLLLVVAVGVASFKCSGVRRRLRRRRPVRRRCDGCLQGDCSRGYGRRAILVRRRQNAEVHLPELVRADRECRQWLRSLLPFSFPFCCSCCRRRVHDRAQVHKRRVRRSQGRIEIKHACRVVTLGTKNDAAAGIIGDRIHWYCV